MHMKEDNLNIEFHKPMSGFVTIGKGIYNGEKILIKKLVIPMQVWDKLPTDINKRNKELEDMLYGRNK